MTSPTSKIEQGTKYIINLTSNHQVLEWSLIHVLWLVGKAWVEQVALTESSEWSNGKNTNIISLKCYFVIISFLSIFYHMQVCVTVQFSIKRLFLSKSLTHHIFSSESVALFYLTLKLIIFIIIMLAVYLHLLRGKWPTQKVTSF